MREAISASADLNEKMGPELSEIVVQPFMDIYREPSDENILKEKSAAYLSPDNVKTLRVPRLNSWLYEIATEEQKQQDRELQNVQSYMMASMSAIAAQAQTMVNLKQWAMNSINSENSDKTHIFAKSYESLMDANHFMTKAMHDTNQFRRRLIKQGMAASFLKLLNENKATPDWLAGVDKSATMPETKCKDAVTDKASMISTENRPNEKSNHLKSYDKDGLEKGQEIPPMPPSQEQDSKDTLGISAVDAELFASLELGGMMGNENEWEDSESDGAEGSNPTLSVQVDRSDSVERSYICSECGKVYKHAGSLRTHIKWHKLDNPAKYSYRDVELMLEKLEPRIRKRTVKNHDCMQCGKRLCSLGSLKIHMLTHTGEKSFVCPNCGKGFALSANLKRHILTHHAGDRPHCCSFCCKGFTKSKDLIRHMKRIHTTEKRFKCNECGKSFTERCTLKRHRITHTGEKPYVCNQCGQACRNLGNLKSHMMTHTGEKPYVCSVCQRGFSRKLTLTTHMATHKEEKPYRCSDCGQIFNNKAALLLHSLTKHKQEKADECGNGVSEVHEVIPVVGKDANYHYVSEEGECESDGTVEYQLSSPVDQPMTDIDEKLPVRNSMAKEFSQLSNENFEIKSFESGAQISVNNHTASISLCTNVPECKNTRQKPYTSNDPAGSPVYTESAQVYKILKSENSFTKETSETKEMIVPAYDGESFALKKDHKLLFLTEKEWGNSGPDAAVKLDLASVPPIYESSVPCERPHVCTVCGKGFKLAGHLKEHMRIHTGEKPYVCSHCGKRFTVSSHLTVHMRKHKMDHSSDKLVCAECGKRFRTIDELKAHVSSHMREKSHVCSHCGEKFSQYDTLQIHMMSHTDKKPFECKVCEMDCMHPSLLKTHMRTHAAHRHECADCGKKFRTLALLQTHMRRHTGEVGTNADKSTMIVDGPGICPHCGKEFKHAGHLRAHIQRHTGGKPEMVTSAAAKPVCPDCGETFSCLSSLKTHMRTHTGEKPHVCSYCAMAFTMLATLRMHIMTHTGEKPFICKGCGKGFRTSSIRKTHIKDSHPSGNCPYCGERFSSAESLDAHVKMHKRNKSLDTLCPICNKTFTTPGSLKGHMLTHTGEKPFLCSECGKTFRAKNNLQSHIRTHTGEKPNKCSYCGDAFNEYGQLVKHVRVHTGERPYVCSECGKAFRASSDLKRHVQVHTGEKPCTCPECGLKLSSHGGLKRHRRTHTGDLPHACLECGKRFHSGWHVREHMRTHTGERPYVCSSCGKRYSDSGSLKNHIARIHQ